MTIFSGNILLDLIGILIAIYVVIYAAFQWNYQTWKRKNVPYFEPTFPFGNIQPLYKSIQLTEDVFNVVKCAKGKGWDYFGIYMIARPLFVLLDLDLVKCILAKDFKHFTDRGSYYNEKDDPISAHLFAIGAPKWKKLRSKLTATFTSGKMKAMFHTLIDASAEFESVLREHDRSNPIDIKQMLVCFTTDVIGSCAFGLDCNSFKEPNSPFIKNGQKVIKLDRFGRIKDLFTTSFPKMSQSLHIPQFSKDLSEFYYNIVTKSINYREKNNQSRNDFLQLLINMKYNKGDELNDNKGDNSTFTMDEIVAQCFVFFFAGFETSSTTMTFALFELATHPDIQERVREELLELLKKYDGNMDYDTMKELVYMQQVIDETLRKYPAVPIITRECVEDYRLPGTDVTIEKGTKVLIPVKNIHYFEEIYENPEEFNPDRFSPENKNKRHQFAHLPFGEGPRNCIGMRFGLMQTKIGLATVLKNYRVTLNPKTKTPLEMDPKTLLIPNIIGGLWLNLEKL